MHQALKVGEAHTCSTQERYESAQCAEPHPDVDGKPLTLSPTLVSPARTFQMRVSRPAGNRVWGGGQCVRWHLQSDRLGGAQAQAQASSATINLAMGQAMLNAHD